MDEGAYDVRGSNVLIVDDVPENLHLLATVLKRGDLVPRPVTSGRRAIEASVTDSSRSNPSRYQHA
jgi:CheY-like chemotaxis protein